MKDPREYWTLKAEKLRKVGKFEDFIRMAENTLKMSD